MDIYEIGEEKFVNGIWGREINGRFYTHVNPLAQSLLYRKLDIDTVSCAYFAQRSCAAADNTEYATSDAFKTLSAYVPKHIRDLGNLKPEDVVWVTT